LYLYLKYFQKVFYPTLAVVHETRRSCTVQRPADQEGQLEIEPLSDRKPVELPQHWRDAATPTSAGDDPRPAPF